MKHAGFTILSTLLVSTLVAGYVLAAVPPPTGVPPAATEPAVVPTQASQGHWEVVIPQTTFGDKLRIAAFFDENFGVTGGAGDPGKAHYTSDGGKTWTVADSSGG